MADYAFNRKLSRIDAELFQRIFAVLFILHSFLRESQFPSEIHILHQLIEFIRCGEIHHGEDICIGVQCYMNIRVPQPLLQYDRRHAGFYTPCRKCVAQRMLSCNRYSCFCREPAEEAVHLSRFYDAVLRVSLPTFASVPS